MVGTEINLHVCQRFLKCTIMRLFEACPFMARWRLLPLPSVHYIISWCTAVTFFRAESCGGAAALHYEKTEERKSVFAAAAMCFGHEISMFSRGLLNGPLRKIHFSNTERKHEWRKASLVLPLIGNANRQYD